MNPTRASSVAFLFLAIVSVGAAADDRADYQRRVAARYETLFQSLDRNSDGSVVRTEAHGDLNFGPRFDDIDINRDGVVTRAELERFLLELQEPPGR